MIRRSAAQRSPSMMMAAGGAFLAVLLLLATVGAAPASTTKSPPTKCDPCPKDVRCVPPIQCPALLQTAMADRPQLCDLPAGTHGYCCTTGQNHTAQKDVHSNTVSRTSAILDGHHHHHHHQDDDARLKLTHITQDARTELVHKLRSEKTLRSPQLTHSDPSFFHNLVFRSGHPSLMMRAIDQTHRAVERIFASRLYKQRQHIPTEEFEYGQVDADLYGTPLATGCGHPVQCPHHAHRHRSLDGSCNNPRHPMWGAAWAPMERLLAPAYEDGIWEPRTYARSGRPLPNARTVSRVLFQDADRPHRLYNLLFMQFGQFLTHDVSHSASITTNDGQSVSCCTADGGAVLPPGQLHWACMPIVIEGHDDLYGRVNRRCISVVRSALSADEGGRCSLGYAKQLSKVSHYIDGSAIYGSDANTAVEVRSFQGGRLHVLDDFGRPMLPLTADPKACGMERGPCFFAGDGRSNQILTLTALHTVFVREHNRVADALAEMNRHWSEELVFQVARQIVVAQLQHIVYSEWLPHVIGSETMDRFQLRVRETDGYSTDYDSEVNACVTSEFTTAAFRFGHSTVDGKFIVKNGPHVEEIISIPDVMFNSARLRRPHFFDEILNTLTQQPMQQVDSVITKGLSGFLFRGHNAVGLDLAAINVQRGRDHGIRSYNDYLEATGNERVRDFQQFGHENAAKLALVYGHPDDIDLWVGGLLEVSHTDALLGYTFAEIIADQFSRLRRGDRYFYELHPDINPGYFTVEQLREVRSASMARILCDNADGDALRVMSPRAFMQPDVEGNAPVSCESVQANGRINFEAWRDITNYV